MPFATIGHPVLKNPLSHDKIISTLTIHTSIWLGGLNYENYENNIYKIEIRNFQPLQLTYAYDDEKAILDQKRKINNYIIWELKTLQGLVKWLEDIFTFYEIELHDLKLLNNQIESENDFSEFLTLKNNSKISGMKFSGLVNNLFKKANDEFILYVSILLYEDYLRVIEFLETKFNHGLPKQISSKSKDKEPKLNLRQIALIYVYNNWHIERGDEANRIAKENKHNSGQALKKHFDFYQNRKNRQANPDETKKVLTNKIELFESVTAHIKEDKRSSLNEDLGRLRSHLEKY